jgi:hypothetical protein
MSSKYYLTSAFQNPFMMIIFVYASLRQWGSQGFEGGEGGEKGAGANLQLI